MDTVNGIEKLAVRPAEAAKIIGIAKTTLAIARMNGDGPPFVRVGRAVLYRRVDLEAWITAIPANHSTSEYDTKGIGRKPKASAKRGGGHE